MIMTGDFFLRLKFDINGKKIKKCLLYIFVIDFEFSYISKFKITLPT